MHAIRSSHIGFFRRLLCASIAATMLLSCNDEGQRVPISTDIDIISSQSVSESIGPEYDAPVLELVLDYLQQIDNDFNQVETAIMALQSEISDFIQQPNAQTLSNLRGAWITGHSSYELTTLHRYFANLVLPEQDALELLQLQYQINHWPILPGYIDYVDGYPYSGIVHDVNVGLDIDSLREQHGLLDISEVTLGFHVLEYLIWGENVNGESPRPASDYSPITVLSTVEAENGFALEQLSNNRRRLLLPMIAQATLEDFQQAKSVWSDQSSSFRLRLERVGPDDRANTDSISIPSILLFLIEAMTDMLTEELLVRSLYPMLNGEFTESIQSPFSHSTQNAISSQLSGLERLLLENQTESGTTLDSLFSSISEEFSEFFYQNFDSSKACLILLYSDLDSSPASDVAVKSEFEVVECINLLNNMIDYLEQLKSNISA